MKIGILSDTHNLLRPEVTTALRGCEALLHAGDISKPPILAELEALAPVYVVRGNNDWSWADHIPLTLDFELCGLRVCMAHRRRDLPADLSPFDLAVFGHSHKYEESRQGKTLILNPGSCGPRRFGQAVTLALAEVEAGRIEVTRVDILQTPPARARTADLRAQVETVMRETARGRGPGEIAARHGWDPALARRIAQLVVTHPGVPAEGILDRLGL